MTKEVTKEKKVAMASREKGLNGLLRQLETLAELWERMDMIVQAEWKLLLDNDLTRLIKLSRIKENLASKIKDEEEGLRLMVSYEMPQLAKKREGLTQALIEESLGARDGRRFLRLLRRRDYFKQLVFATNRRILYWLEDRSGFVEELTAILSGRDMESGPTYSPLARGPNRKRPRLSSRGRSFASGSNMSHTDEIKRGVAGYARQIKFRSTE